MRVSLLLLGALLSVSLPARAESPAPSAGEAPARYTMTPADGGFLRLDTQTGDVSFCTLKDGEASCRAGADEKSALESEVARLKRENAELKSRLYGSPSARSKGLPSEEEFERSLSYAERFLRRMMKILRDEGAADKI